EFEDASLKRSIRGATHYAPHILLWTHDNLSAFETSKWCFYINKEMQQDSGANISEEKMRCGTKKPFSITITTF
ncbi:hypothetical protein JG687_00016017, partial [Phytophthora cactorum]